MLNDDDNMVPGFFYGDRYLTMGYGSFHEATEDVQVRLLLRKLKISSGDFFPISGRQIKAIDMPKLLSSFFQAQCSSPT